MRFVPPRRAFDALNAADPVKAKKVHIFNSFFYKKLSTKKTSKEDA